MILLVKAAITMFSTILWYWRIYIGKRSSVGTRMIQLQVLLVELVREQNTETHMQ